MVRMIKKTFSFLPFPKISLEPFSALKESFKNGYSFKKDFRFDLLSGIIVGLVAIPLGMALGIASGVSPQNGLYTVIIGGALVALLGGSRFQVTGPTAAFVVILAPIVEKFGLGGLLIAGFMAGCLLLAMGLTRMGRMIQFIPHPVTTGFTSGIAVVIATLQLKDFFGLQVEKMPEFFLEKVFTLFKALPSFHWSELFVGLTTLLILIYWPKINKKIPGPLVALVSVTLGVLLLRKFFPQFEVATIQSRFTFNVNGLQGQGIPPVLPSFHWPWEITSPGGSPLILNMETIRALLPSAFAISLLGGIESLLSAVVADGMANTKHDPDSELIALGIGNMVCPFFAGIPATGAIARTATNIRFGARSPLSAVIHALFTMLVIVLFAPAVSYLPMASMAALLLIVAYNMSELKNFKRILRISPRSDVLVLLTCFGLTVVFDMVIGVSVGIILASLLFMRRMAHFTSIMDLSNIELPKELTTQMSELKIPQEVIVYEIAGPLFFGAAEKAASTIGGITDNITTVIFKMDQVPIMDITGFVALQTSIENLQHGQARQVYLVGVGAQPREVIEKSKILSKNLFKIKSNVKEALDDLSKLKNLNDLHKPNKPNNLDKTL